MKKICIRMTTQFMLISIIGTPVIAAFFSHGMGN